MCAVVDKKLTVEEAVNLSRLELNFQVKIILIFKYVFGIFFS